MVKTLRRIGNSYGVIIDRPIMELLGMDSQTRLEMTVHNGGLLLRPITDAGDHKASVRKSSARMAKIHRQSLRELAD